MVRSTDALDQKTALTIMGTAAELLTVDATKTPAFSTFIVEDGVSIVATYICNGKAWIKV